MRQGCCATLYKMKTASLSVFFPTYNEEGNIAETVNKAIGVLENLKLKYEILIINDGSKDSTLKVIEGLAKKNPNIKVINHPQNLGYGEALKSGFYNSKYDTIVYTDGDGQFDFKEVTKFLEKIDEYDLLIGYRIKRQDPILRKIFGKGWKLSIWTFFQLPIKDVDCGFKMVKKKVLEKIPHLESQRGAMINAELAVKAKKFGFKVGQVGVNHYPRLSGKPTGNGVKVIIKSYLDLIRLWWKLKEQKLLFLSLLGVLLMALFLRLYQIEGYMTFLGDEGRDVILVKKILTGENFPLIGPPTSVGNIYLGPLYYYMMAFSMMFWFSPISAAIMNALIGVVTVFLVYYLGKIWFNKSSGLVASFLYAISPVTITYSKTSWNPNPVPFFALFSMIFFNKAKKSKDFTYLIFTGIFLGAALQMHYLALILIPIFVLLWGLEVFSKKQPIKNLVSGTIFGILGFVLTLSPLILFDIKHNFVNYRAIIELLSSGTSVKGNTFLNLLKIPNIYSHDLIGRYLAGENYYLTLVISLLIVLVLFRKKWANMVLAIWLGVGLLGLSFYQGSIYDHYLGFLNPTPFLLLGSLFSINYKRFNKIAYAFLGVLVIILTIVNFQKSPLSHSPNNQLQKTIKISKHIIEKAENKDFNFALLSKNNYDSAYQFYLNELGYKPKMQPFEKTPQLFVVCEDESCDPTHSPKYELASYGLSKIEWMENYEGVKLYKLAPNPSGKP
jgi:glycosyltransferase involved in cell wall biosynthesis